MGVWLETEGKKHIKTHLEFVRKHQSDPGKIWDMILLTDETEMEISKC